MDESKFKTRLKQACTNAGGGGHADGAEVCLFCRKCGRSTTIDHRRVLQHDEIEVTADCPRCGVEREVHVHRLQVGLEAREAAEMIELMAEAAEKEEKSAARRKARKRKKAQSGDRQSERTRKRKAARGKPERDGAPAGDVVHLRLVSSNDASPPNPTVFTDENWELEVKSSAIPVLVQFWVRWSGPCRAISRIVEELASDYANRVKVGRLNIDENERAVRSVRITSIPNVLLFNEGKLVQEIPGMQTKADYAAALDAELGRMSRSTAQAPLERMVAFIGDSIEGWVSAFAFFDPELNSVTVTESGRDGLTVRLAGGRRIRLSVVEVEPGGYPLPEQRDERMRPIVEGLCQAVHTAGGRPDSELYVSYEDERHTAFLLASNIGWFTVTASESGAIPP